MAKNLCMELLWHFIKLLVLLDSCRPSWYFFYASFYLCHGHWKTHWISSIWISPHITVWCRIDGHSMPVAGPNEWGMNESATGGEYWAVGALLTVGNVNMLWGPLRQSLKAFLPIITSNCPALQQRSRQAFHSYRSPGSEILHPVNITGELF